MPISPERIALIEAWRIHLPACFESHWEVIAQLTLSPEEGNVVVPTKEDGTYSLDEFKWEITLRSLKEVLEKAHPERSDQLTILLIWYGHSIDRWWSPSASMMEVIPKKLLKYYQPLQILAPLQHPDISDAALTGLLRYINNVLNTEKITLSFPASIITRIISHASQVHPVPKDPILATHYREGLLTLQRLLGVDSFTGIRLVEAAASNGFQDQQVSFALELLRQGLAGSSTNYLISPLSISIALQMLLNGAGGATAQALRQFLSLEAIELAELNENQRLFQLLLSNVNQTTTINLANSLWPPQSISIEANFTNALTHFYNADVRSLVSGDPTAINQWVSTKTNGKIKSLIDELEPLQSLLLINAVYFNATWEHPFSLKDTKPEPFYLSTGDSTPCAMMHYEIYYQYLENDYCQAIQLPYKDSPFHMLVMLPYPASSIDELIHHLSPETWASWMASFKKAKVRLSLPRFEFRATVNLKKILQHLGLTIPFDAQAADFSGIAAMPLWIDEILHQGYIRVDEKGTEATVATAVKMYAGGYIEPDIVMKVNRPFLFAIQDQQSGAILFMGAVKDPS